MKKRAVLYARVSGDDRGREGRNIASQLEMCRDFALQNGWTVVAELSEDDRGAPGASFELPELDRAREMARKKEFDVFVVRELDRLSRKLAKQLIVEEELNRAGVEVAYVLATYDDSPEGRLNKHIRATVAEYEREKIAERMVRGRRQVVKSGKIMLHGNKPPYGYRLSSDGTNLEIYEPEAAIIRMVFKLYVDGDENGNHVSTRAIAKRLTDMQVPTWADHRPYFHKKRPRGEWSHALVLRLLQVETYIGKWRYGKRRTKKSKTRPPEIPLTLDVPAIISREMWERAQVQRRKNFDEAKRNLKREYLLRGRVRCGNCDSSIVSYAKLSTSKTKPDKAYYYYRCNGMMGNIANVKCDLPSFRVELVDALVWGWVKTLLTDSTVFETGLKLYQEQQEEMLIPIRRRMVVVDDLWNDTKSQYERVVELYVGGDVPRDILVDKKQRLETTLSVLNDEKQQLSSQLDGKILTEADLMKIRAFAKQASEEFELDEVGFQGRRRLIEMLDVHAKLYVENGEKIVEVWCILGTGELPIVETSIQNAVRATDYRWSSVKTRHRQHHTCRRAP
jgi:site-specific DNA recombinase